MKRLGMWILLVGISFILAACLDKSKSQVSPYEFSLLQDFAQTSKLPMPQIEETSFEWQEGEEKLTVQ
jgi:lipoprotein